MQINKLPPSNKTEPVSPAHSYKHDLTEDESAALRGRVLMPKDLSTDSPSSTNDSRPLKIKLTVPLSFRKKPYEVPSRHATAAVLAKRARPRKIRSTNDEGAEYAPPRGYKPSKSLVTTAQTLSASAPLSRSVQVHHPPPDQPRFPTFVPASVLSSDDLSGSDDSALTDEEETEEEPYAEDTLVIDPHERARTRRELLGNNDNQVPTRAPWKYNRQTNSKRQTPTASALVEDGDGSGSSGNEEDDENSDDEDEDDEDEEAEADHPTPMQTETLSDDEDDKLDAQLFFSNFLAESSGSEDDAQTDRDSVMDDIIVGAAESDTDTDVEVGQYEEALMVKEGWDGELVFSTEIHPPGGLLDFELLGPSPERDAIQVEDADSLANSLSTLPVTQPATVSDEEFEEVASEAGETTDDEIMPPNLVSLPFATTISPHATFTPHRRPINLHQLNTSLPSPSPADVLAGTNNAPTPWDFLSSPVHSIATTDEPPPRSRSVSVHSFGSRGPRIGFFNAANFGSKRTIIGDTPGKLPSPFSVLTPPAPVFRRKRRANSDLGSFFTKRTRNGGPLASSYFSDDLIGLPQGQLVDLDDLLDASLLSEDIDRPNQTDANDSALSRWDRIPLGIYRQTRDTPAAHASSMSFSFAVGGFDSVPRPDFVSPARSHVSHGSIDSILWDDEIRPPSEMRRGNHHHNHGHSNKKRHREHEFDEPFFLSPPSRAGPSRGDRTPTQSRASLGDMSADFLSEAKSRKDRRKEKKREKASLQKQILSALDETLAEDYDELITGEDVIP